MSTTTYCDHCGKPCSGHRPEWTLCRLSLPKGNWEADLCELCVDELLAFIGRTERYATVGPDTPEDA